jgi:hypothetical protein
MEDSPASGGEDEVVEPDQGNSKPTLPRNAALALTEASPLAHHLAAATWRRPESGRAAHVHSRAEVYAGAHHQVGALCYLSCAPLTESS